MVFEIETFLRQIVMCSAMTNIGSRNLEIMIVFEDARYVCQVSTSKADVNEAEAGARNTSGLDVSQAFFSSIGVVHGRGVSGGEEEEAEERDVSYTSTRSHRSNCTDEDEEKLQERKEDPMGRRKRKSLT